MTTEPEFIPGLDLAEAYYWEAVRPILLRHFPDLPHTAALIGFGSDVIGCDTPMSRDHLWGPRMQIFIPPVDYDGNRKLIHDALRHELPYSFRGYSTHFSDQDTEGVRRMEQKNDGPVEHMVEVFTIENFFRGELDVDAFTEPSIRDWLTFQEHRLLTLTAGRVFNDDLGLETVRARFAYYPTELWYYLLSAQWMLISQEEPFMGRTGDNGDELGSRIITSRLVDRLVHLCFLMEKRYAPYSKWLGTLFQRLEIAHQINPLLLGALSAKNWIERENWLSQAYLIAVQWHNELKITAPAPVQVSPFHSRPFQVIHAGEIAAAILDTIKDPVILALTPYVGSVNQFMVESSDGLQRVDITAKTRSLF